MNTDSILRQREAVHEDWAGRAKHWDRRADQVAEPAVHLNMPMLEAADIQSGQNVLDIATGAGEPGLTIAKLIGPAGRLTMSDMVPEMLDGAKRRAGEQGLSNIDYVIADMADLPSDDNSFDRAICRFGLMFCPEKSTAVSEVFRILKPGGRAAWMVWGPKQNNSSFEVIDAAVVAVFGADNPLYEMEIPLSLSEAGSLRALVSEAGFETEGEQDIKLYPKPPADKPFWSAMVDMATGRIRDAAGPEQRADFDREIERRFAELIKEDRYHISMHARICTGVKPA